ncbi:MAG: hypothetical protein H6Q00_2416 [Holophagaceae bacterium]|nr:hypothetical protein [Holophagaceae bacterium]
MEEALSDRVQIITHRGHKIVFVDNTGLKPAEIIALHPILTKMAIDHKINLICNDVTNTTSDEGVKKSAQESIAATTSALGKIHSAIIGIRGIQKILANAMVRDQYFASDKEDALDWLVKQAEK